MKVLFAKYNNQRVPQFSIATKIIEQEGKLFSLKTPLSKEANEHIENIYNNYYKLKTSNFMKLVPPTKSGDSILFDYLPHHSVEEMLLHFYNSNDLINFDLTIKKYINFIDTMRTKKTSFVSTSNFREIFGDVSFDGSIEIVSLANIDLIFENIFIVEDEFIVIDYEWVFEFDMPKDFIIARALVQLSYKCPFDIKIYLPKYDLYKDTFFEMENNFYNFVFSKERRYSLNSAIQKRNIDIVNEYQDLKKHSKAIDQELKDLQLEYAQLQNIAQSLRLKNRIKNLLTFKKKRV